MARAARSRSVYPAEVPISNESLDRIERTSLRFALVCQISAVLSIVALIAASKLAPTSNTMWLGFSVVASIGEIMVGHGLPQALTGRSRDRRGYIDIATRGRTVSAPAPTHFVRARGAALVFTGVLIALIGVASMAISLVELAYPRPSRRSESFGESVGPRAR